MSYRVKAVESLSVGKLTGSRLSIGVPMILIYKQSGWTWPARKITDRKDMFFSIVETAVSSIFYGVMATCAVMAILYLILKSVDRSIVKSLAFYLTGIVLAILLIIQCSGNKRYQARVRLCLRRIPNPWYLCRHHQLFGARTVGFNRNHT